MAYYHYNCDDIDDNGWGCVYRSCQNALKLQGLKVPSISSMMNKGVKNNYSKWIEPAQLSVLFENNNEVMTDKCIYLENTDNIRKMQFTKPEDYDTIFSDKCKFKNWLIQRLSDSYSIIVDDGIFGYCLYQDLIFDPHTMNPNDVTRNFDLEEFCSNITCCMAYALKKNNIFSN